MNKAEQNKLRRERDDAVRDCAKAKKAAADQRAVAQRLGADVDAQRKLAVEVDDQHRADQRKWSEGLQTVHAQLQAAKAAQSTAAATEARIAELEAVRNEERIAKAWELFKAAVLDPRTPEEGVSSYDTGAQKSLLAVDCFLEKARPAVEPQEAPKPAPDAPVSTPDDPEAALALDRIRGILGAHDGIGSDAIIEAIRNMRAEVLRIREENKLLRKELVAKNATDDSGA